MVANYYELPEVSSSDLSALERKFYGLPDNREDLKGIFNFGSLVDAMVSERRKLDVMLHTLTEDDGNVIEFDYKVWKMAEKMADTLRKDKLVALMLKIMVGQYIFRRTLRFVYDDDGYEIRARCKLDGYCKEFGIGLDYKTTSCKTYKAFVESIAHFNYDRQAAYYMDIAGINSYWIIGISKVTNEVFKFAIARGDETHSRGVAKYSIWAYRWIIYIQDFTINLLN